MNHHTPQGLPLLPTPDSFLFQHEETGNTQFVDGQQVEWGFEKNNPRLQKIGGVYTEIQMLAYAREALAAQAVDASEIYKRGWVACAGWAKRPDLIADIDSPAYANERAARLATKESK